MNDKYEQYKKFVLTNCSSTGINSRCNAIEIFCEKFDLTITWCGLLPSNQAFTKTLKQMEKDGLIRYAFKNKVDRGWGSKGGNLVTYAFTSKGYDIRNEMLKEI